MNSKQIALCVGSGIAAAGITYYLYSKIFAEPIEVESTNSILCASDDMINPDLSIEEYTSLIK